MLQPAVLFVSINFNFKQKGQFCKQNVESDNGRKTESSFGSEVDKCADEILQSEFISVQRQEGIVR